MSSKQAPELLMNPAASPLSVELLPKEFSESRQGMRTQKLIHYAGNSALETVLGLFFNKTKESIEARGKKALAITFVGSIASIGLFKGENLIYPNNVSANSLKGSEKIYKRSSLKPQSILNSIHHIAKPDDPWKPKDKFRVQPTSASLNANEAVFKTDCGRNKKGPGYIGNTWSYKVYKRSIYGVSYTTCGPMGIPHNTPAAEIHEYEKPLNLLGKKIQKSVRLIYAQKVKNIKGNRSLVIAKYECPSETDISEPGSQVEGVKSISIRSKNKKALISKC